jgi:hypothetical protein
MKWVIYMVISCCVYDVLAINYVVKKQNIDEPSGGLYLPILLTIIIYTALMVLFIEKKNIFDNNPIRSIFFLAPSFMFLLMHVLVLGAGFDSLIHWIFQTR